VELLVVIAIILLILADALPKFKEAHLNAIQAMVVRELQTIGQSQVQNQSQFGKYPLRDRRLLIGSLLVWLGEKNGYVFVMTLTSIGYSVNANPKVSGRRTSYLGQDGAEPCTRTGEQNQSAQQVRNSSR
jgi:hypothetical protein